MKYTIEASDGICTESLEFPNGDKFVKRSKRTSYGSQDIDDEFSDQLERAGYTEDIVDAVYDMFDGFGSLDFLELDDLVNGRY